jgi:transcriptional regulator with XRE-family HTH domain
MGKRSPQKPKETAPEWKGFSGRLRYAVDTRRAESEGLSQNAIAEKAGVDGGNLSRMLDGTYQHVTANTVLLLARALRVNAAWLLTGEEPSGLSKPAQPDQDTPIPSSQLRESRRP